MNPRWETNKKNLFNQKECSERVLVIADDRLIRDFLRKDSCCKMTDKVDALIH